MLDTLVLILIGMFIGWNVPQPKYAKFFQARMIALYNRVKARIKARKSK